MNKKNKTHAPNPKNDVKKWHTIDAEGKILGRVATEIATLIVGKHKPTFSPNQEMGDKVVVTNASKIKVTGRKLKDKIYYRHTSYPGGLKSETLGELMDRLPTEALKRAVHGMLPKNKLRDDRMKNLFVYEDANHPHKAQLGE